MPSSLTFRDVPRLPGGRYRLKGEHDQIVDLDLSLLERAIRVIREAGQNVEAITGVMPRQMSAPPDPANDSQAVLVNRGLGARQPAAQDSNDVQMLLAMRGLGARPPAVPEPNDATALLASSMLRHPAALESGLVVLNRKTASTSATIDFNLVGSRFASYLVTLAHVAPATDAVELWMRTSTDGGTTFDAGASDYRWANYSNNDAAVSGANGDTADSEMNLAFATMGNAANETISGAVYIYAPSQAKYGSLNWHIQYVDDAGNMGNSTGSGQRISAADVDAIRFLFSSGNIASGVFTLYGLPA